MNTDSNNAGMPNSSDPESMSHVDGDLRSLIVGLDRLGAKDRAGAGSDLEDHLMQATLASLHGVQPIMAQAAELGAMDRASAPSDLEEGVFADSLPALREGVEKIAAPVLRHVGDAQRAPREHARIAHRGWWTSPYVRLAAAILLVAGAGFMVRTNVTPKAPARDFSGDMELLFAAMESKPAASTPSDEPASDQETDDLTKWLIEGAAS